VKVQLTRTISLLLSWETVNLQRMVRHSMLWNIEYSIQLYL